MKNIFIILISLFLNFSIKGMEKNNEEKKLIHDLVRLECRINQLNINIPYTSEEYDYFIINKLEHFIYYSIKLNKLEILVKILLHFDAINHQNSFGKTPLSYAASYQSAPLIALLIQNGANVDKTTSKGDTALIICAQLNFWKGIIILTRARADYSINNINGQKISTIF